MRSLRSVQAGGLMTSAGDREEAHAPRTGALHLELLAVERDRMSQRVECLTRNRDAIAGYLDAVHEATTQRNTTGAA